MPRGPRQVYQVEPDRVVNGITERYCRNCKKFKPLGIYNAQGRGEHLCPPCWRARRAEEPSARKRTGRAVGWMWRQSKLLLTPPV